MLSRLSIRWRITLGSVAIAIVVIGAALVVVRLQVSSILTSSDRALAVADLTAYRAEIVDNPDGLIDDSGHGSLVYVRNPGGVVEIDTLPHDLREQVEHRRTANEEFSGGDDGTTFIVVGRAVPTSAGTWAIWAARSTAASTLAMGAFDRALIIGTAVLLLLFAIASWALASAALRPVSRMRREAEQLSAEQGPIDLPIGPARDEISALGTTLNAFLARVRASTAREKQVVSDAAHELRTPLAALKTQLELAHDNFDDAPALSRQVIAAEGSVDRLSLLASNLLALSRLESGEARNAESTGEQLLSELMMSVDNIRLLALDKHVEVSFSADSAGLQSRFAIAPESFARVVENLGTNAVVAVAEGGAVHIAIRHTDDSLDLIVSDDGPGMAEEFIARAFDRFSRGDEARTRSTGGSGLGLALVHAIVTAAHGTVDVVNSAHGLTVEVRLPKM